MRVLVVGAAGRTGKLVTERALEAGHQVVALVHDSEGTVPAADSVEVVHGDVRNPSRLEAAMTGCDAVIDALGGKTPWASTDLEVGAAEVVLEVMGRVGARRLIVISVLGAHESKEQAPWMYEHLLMPTYLHGAMKDKDAMEDVVRQSDVDWVLVRPPVLSGADPVGSVQVVPPGVQAHRITRGDLAQFLVDQLTADTYLRQAVTVANS